MRSVLEAWPSTTMPSRLHRYRSDCEGMSESDAFKMISWLEIGESQELASANCEPIDANLSCLPYCSPPNKHGSILASRAGATGALPLGTLAGALLARATRIPRAAHTA
jgi:hypothetical protein